MPDRTNSTRPPRRPGGRPEPAERGRGGRRRPDPDRLLETVRREEERARRGRLKIYFGACAGVGKTYTMLEHARRETSQGRDVVVGWVETHGRKETAALLEGLERLPARAVEHRGVRLEEFDLDAALARRPALLLLDELAHTNPDGSRHAKRFQDVLELLEAGVNVATTLNVQHLESLNDVVAQITGIVVRETVPDSVFDQADEVELVDLPPDELIARLRDGRVYVPEQAGHAIESFFRPGNLIALRELSLRRTAERVDEQMRRYRREHRIERTWPTSERLLVCVGPNPESARLVRAAARMAARLGADWTAAYVETPAQPHLPEADRRTLEENLRLAERLGGRTAVLSGHSISAEILAYARDQNVSKIVAGKPTHPRWRDRLLGSLVDEIVRGSGEIDVYIISGEAGEERTIRRRVDRPRGGPRAYARAALVVALCTLVSWAMTTIFSEANIVMIYLLGVAYVSTRFRRGPAAFASILSVAAFDFFFVPPYLTFAVGDAQYLVTFVVMLAVALLISTLALRVREQGEAARERERRTAVLYEMSRGLVALRTPDGIAQAAAGHVASILSMPCAVVLPRRDRVLVPIAPEGIEFALDPRDAAVAQWAFDHGKPAGIGTDSLPGAGATFLPLQGTRGPVGILAVRPADPEGPTAEQFHLLEALAGQTTAALERALLADEAQQAMIAAERERLRSALLSSVSHDLRTPLAAVAGAASTLLQQEASLEPSERRDLLETIHEETDWLNRLVGNLLDMTRVEAGAVTPKKEWQPLEEVVGAAMTRLEERLRARPVDIRLPDDLPLVPLDSQLMEQVLVNLLDDALKYTPDGSPIHIRAWAGEGDVTLEVADEGPGIPAGDEERVFEKFYRAPDTRGRPGAGLGLAICRGFVNAHGGRIRVESRPGGGAAFRITLPVPADGPRVPREEGAADAGRA